MGPNTFKLSISEWEKGVKNHQNYADIIFEYPQRLNSLKIFSGDALEEPIQMERKSPVLVDIGS